MIKEDLLSEVNWLVSHGHARLDELDYAIWLAVSNHLLGVYRALHDNDPSEEITEWCNHAAYVLVGGEE